MKTQEVQLEHVRALATLLHMATCRTCGSGRKEECNWDWHNWEEHSDVEWSTRCIYLRRAEQMLERANGDVTVVTDIILNINS